MLTPEKHCGLMVPSPDFGVPLPFFAHRVHLSFFRQHGLKPQKSNISRLPVPAGGQRVKGPTKLSAEIVIRLSV